MKRLIALLVLVFALCALAPPAKAVSPSQYSLVLFEIAYYGDGSAECGKYYFTFVNSNPSVYAVNGYAVYGTNKYPFTGTALTVGVGTNLLQVSIIAPANLNDSPWTEEFTLNTTTLTGEGFWAYTDSSDHGTITLSKNPCPSPTVAAGTGARRSR